MTVLSGESVDWIATFRTRDGKAPAPRPSSGVTLEILDAEDLTVTILAETAMSTVEEDSGTATGGTLTTLEDTSQDWDTDEWKGEAVVIAGGTGSGQERVIKSNTATELTVEEAWNTPPDATSDYFIHAGDWLLRWKVPDGSDRQSFIGVARAKDPDFAGTGETGDGEVKERHRLTIIEEEGD